VNLERTARELARTDTLHLLLARRALDVIKGMADGSIPVRGDHPFTSFDSSHPWDYGRRSMDGRYSVLWYGGNGCSVYSVSFEQASGASVEIVRARPWAMNSDDEVERLFIEMDQVIWATPHDHHAFKFVHDFREDYKD